MQILMTYKTEARRLAVCLLTLTVFLSTLFVCPAEARKEDDDIYQLSDLAGKTIAVQTGTSYDTILAEKDYFGGKVTLDYYNSTPDGVEAVRKGKAAATILDLPVAKIYCNKNPELMILPEKLITYECGFGFPKGSPFVGPFNQALAQLQQEGVLEQLEAKWTGADESVKTIMAQDWEPVNGTLRYWNDGTYEPIAYLGEDGNLLGYDFDVALHVAEIAGYHLEFTNCGYDALIPALISGKADIVSSGMAITADRAKSIDFSDPYYTGSVVVVVRNPDHAAAGGTSFRDSVASSFRRTFLTENRWKLFARGIGNTLLITVMSILLGTVLGFGVYLLCRTTHPAVASGFETLFSLLERMPIIVLLMILYYIIFGSAKVSGILVSIVAFTLTFTSAMYGMLKTGVKAVSYGQTEAAYALGYTREAAFFKIVLPQAARFFLPSYRSELIALVKGTAVVGYIAVQDLTKMSDIVRSRTYEAFFPLIATAIIYAALTWLLTLLIGKLERILDPRHRSRASILKGVTIK